MISDVIVYIEKIKEGKRMKIGFSNEKYLKMQSEHILERIPAGIPAGFQAADAPSAEGTG